jgi:hypothetical protein
LPEVRCRRDLTKPEAENAAQGILSVTAATSASVNPVLLVTASNAVIYTWFGKTGFRFRGNDGNAGKMAKIDFQVAFEIQKSS